MPRQSNRAPEPEPPCGVVAASLQRVSIGPQAFVRVAKVDDLMAMAARTRYRTLAATERAALVELSPTTGRMHQLRVHLASLGRPILGDARYGGALVLDGRAVPRLMLHARAIVFPHPAGGKLRVEAPIPDDFRNLAEALGLKLTAGGVQNRPEPPVTTRRRGGRAAERRRAAGGS